MGADGVVTLGTDAFKMYLPSWSLKGSLRAFKIALRTVRRRGSKIKFMEFGFSIDLSEIWRVG